MAISITTSPATPTTRAPCRVSFAASGGGNYVRVWVTDAPLGSKLKQQLTDSGQHRIALHEGGIGEVLEFRPDVAGAYVLACQEITRGASTYGGGYRGDPNGYPSESLIGENAQTLSVAQRLEMPLGAGADRTTLVCWVHGSSIIETLAHVHGEASPAIVNPTSARARTAAAGTGTGSVLEAALALRGVAATTALGTLATVATNIIDKFNAHLTQAGVHDANDTNNAISASFKNPSTPVALQASLREILDRLSRHMRNDSGSGTGTGAYHRPGATVDADWTNVPLASAPGDLAGAVAALADCWRAYEAHRTSSVHDASDTTNTLTALPALLEVHKRFLAVVASLSPTAPATANSGATLLLANGFTESTP